MSNSSCILFDAFRHDVLLPKTPAAKRHKKQMTTKRTRTLRSTTALEAVDSGVELEPKKSRLPLDVLKEKSNEEEIATAVKVTDAVPATTSTVAEARRKTEENKENIDAQVSGDSKQISTEKECDKVHVGDKQLVATSLSDPTSVVSSQVLAHDSYCFADVISFLLFCIFLLLSTYFTVWNFVSKIC